MTYIPWQYNVKSDCWLMMNLNDIVGTIMLLATYVPNTTNWQFGHMMLAKECCWRCFNSNGGGVVYYFCGMYCQVFGTWGLALWLV
jgi:hypothetical protein